MKRALTVFVCLIVFVPAAYAESVPPTEMDTLTKNCMGGETPQQNPDRARYCQCMRDSMSSWSAEDFKEVAAESAKAHDAGQEPAKLQELAKACITKVLGPLPQ
jgi:hypothetical protein